MNERYKELGSYCLPRLAKRGYTLVELMMTIGLLSMFVASAVLMIFLVYTGIHFLYKFW